MTASGRLFAVWTCNRKNRSEQKSKYFCTVRVENYQISTGKFKYTCFLIKSIFIWWYVIVLNLYYIITTKCLKNYFNAFSINLYEFIKFQDFYTNIQRSHIVTTSYFKPIFLHRYIKTISYWSFDGLISWNACQWCLMHTEIPNVFFFLFLSNRNVLWEGVLRPSRERPGHAGAGHQKHGHHHALQVCCKYNKRTYYGKISCKSRTRVHGIIIFSPRTE